MKASFFPEYAFDLGYHDGREYGTKNPNRDFKRDATDERSIAYFNGLRVGVAESQAVGLDIRCLVHWDTPGFDTPVCGAVASHVAFAFGHVIPVCEKHSHVQRGRPEWSIVPIAWV